MRTEFWLGSLKGRDHSEDIVADGRIILKWILDRMGACERALVNAIMNLSGLINGWGFVYYLSDCQLLLVGSSSDVNMKV
jgi:hypothetical protein